MSIKLTIIYLAKRTEHIDNQEPEGS